MRSLLDDRNNVKTPFHSLIISCFAIACVLLQGCVNLKPKPDLTAYYVLGESASGEMGSSESPSSAVLYIARPEIPAFLDSNRLLYRDSEGALLEIENARWAEPLPQSISRALAESLGVVGDATYEFYPWQNASSEALEVRVHLQRIEAYTDGRFVLMASWELKTLNGSKQTGQFYKDDLRWDRGDAKSYIVAMNAALNSLALEIAQKL